jgi:hypothetical protein
MPRVQARGDRREAAAGTSRRYSPDRRERGHVLSLAPEVRQPLNSRPLRLLCVTHPHAFVLISNPKKRPLRLGQISNDRFKIRLGSPL